MLKKTGKSYFGGHASSFDMKVWCMFRQRGISNNDQRWKYAISLFITVEKDTVHEEYVVCSTMFQHTFGVSIS